MMPEVLYPLIALIFTGISVATAIFFNSKNAKRNEVQDLRNRIEDLDGRMKKCEDARDNLARENLELMKQLIAKSYPGIAPIAVTPVVVQPAANPGNTMEATKVEIKAVE